MEWQSKFGDTVARENRKSNERKELTDRAIEQAQRGPSEKNFQDLERMAKGDLIEDRDNTVLAEFQACKKAVKNLQNKNSNEAKTEVVEKMQTLGLLLEEMLERSHTADMELCDHEQNLRDNWLEKKRRAEHYQRQLWAVTGMMQLCRRRVCEQSAQETKGDGDGKEKPGGALDAGEAAGPNDMDSRTESGPTGGEAWALAPQEQGRDVLKENPEIEHREGVQQRSQGLSVSASPFVPSENRLVEVPVAVGGNAAHLQAQAVAPDLVGDGVEGEEWYKEHHAGSREHPVNCKPCHFQGDLCWKGLSCGFCHVCPKPKRKSKHQRDVDKRRQERYRQVNDQLGTECCEVLAKIDDSRRFMMTQSEELKKRVKEAYQSTDTSDHQRKEVKALVAKMQQAVMAFAIQDLAKEEEEDERLPEGPQSLVNGNTALAPLHSESTEFVY